MEPSISAKQQTGTPVLFTLRITHGHHAYKSRDSAYLTHTHTCAGRC